MLFVTPVQLACLMFCYLATNMSYIFRMRTSSTISIQKLFFFNYCITWRVFYKKQEMLTLREHLSSPPVIWLCPCCSFFQFFVLSYYVSLRSEFRVVMYVTISTYNRCSVRLYLRLLLGGRLSYLRYLYLFVQCWVQHILCCVFVLSFFVLCTLCCPCLGIVIFRLVYPMLPVSRDCLSQSCVPYVARFSGLSISDCHFGIH